MNGRLYLHALYEILRCYTDEEHILSRSEIIGILECSKGIVMKEKKFYRSIDALIDKGYPISKYSENRKGYYLKRNPEDISKYLLLSHVISSSTLLSEKQSKEYVNELLKPLSIYQRKLFTNIVYHPLKKRQEISDWLPCIYILHQAILDNHTVQFTYTHYNVQKQLCIEKGPFLVDPYLIAFNESYTYLVGWNHAYNNYSHYRIDRICSITITDKSFKTPDRLCEAYDYAKSKLSMFTGEVVPVTIHCTAKRNILDHMIDELGPDVFIQRIDNDTYEIRTKATISGIVIFAQKYIDVVRIIEPAEAKEQIIKHAKNLLCYYNSSESDESSPSETEPNQLE